MRKKTDRNVVEGSLERFSKGEYGISDILQFSKIWGAWGQFPYLGIYDKGYCTKFMAGISKKVVSVHQESAVAKQQAFVNRTYIYQAWNQIPP